MPSKKKKYNSRFPPARIKKIMQTDEEIGKVAAAVPVLISKCVEMFLVSILENTDSVTSSRNAKTMTGSHLKECIMKEKTYDFLRDLVANEPDCDATPAAANSDETATDSGEKKPPISRQKRSRNTANPRTKRVKTTEGKTNLIKSESISSPTTHRQDDDDKMEDTPSSSGVHTFSRSLSCAAAPQSTSDGDSGDVFDDSNDFGMKPQYRKWRKLAQDNKVPGSGSQQKTKSTANKKTIGSGVESCGIKRKTIATVSCDTFTSSSGGGGGEAIDLSIRNNKDASINGALSPSSGSNMSGGDPVLSSSAPSHPSSNYIPTPPTASAMTELNIMAPPPVRKVSGDDEDDDYDV